MGGRLRKKSISERERGGFVLRGLLAAAVLLLAIGSANAQTRSLVETDPPAPTGEKTEPAQPPALVEPDPPAPTSEKAEPAQPPAPDTRPDGFTVGGFVFKPGGRIKLDIIRDFDPIGSEDTFDPRTIPLDQSEGGNSNLIAKESRLFLDIRGPVEGKELQMYLETDFYGSSSVLRLRHAYGRYGGLLAGQTWSTFVDESNFPNTIDFENPIAFPSIRQAQVRWTQKVGASVSWSVAVEDNKSAILPPVSVPGKAEFPMPDLVTHVRFVRSRGHAQASGFLGRARFRPTGGEPDDETLWGVLLSGRIKTVGKDYAYAQFTFGEGIGRYRGATTAVPDENNQLHAPGLHAFTGGYDHYWVPRLSSNVVWAQATSPDKPFYPPDFNHQLDYTAINLLYWFIENRAWAGVEYLHGGREVFSGQTSSADRLQFAVRFNLP